MLFIAVQVNKSPNHFRRLTSLQQSKNFWILRCYRIGLSYARTVIQWCRRIVLASEIIDHQWDWSWYDLLSDPNGSVHSERTCLIWGRLLRPEFVDCWDSYQLSRGVGAPMRFIDWKIGCWPNIARGRISLTGFTVFHHSSQFFDSRCVTD